MTYEPVILSKSEGSVKPFTTLKVWVATEKPFAAAAVNGSREIVEAAGHELALLEKYTEKEQLLELLCCCNYVSSNFV